MPCEDTSLVAYNTAENVLFVLDREEYSLINILAEFEPIDFIGTGKEFKREYPTLTEEEHFSSIVRINNVYPIGRGPNGKGKETDYSSASTPRG